MGLVALAFALAGGQALAQLQQYTPAGSLAERGVPSREQLKESMKQARWHLGRVRIAPWLGLKDVMYVDNVFGTAEGARSDLTATVGAGVHGYLPVGAKLVLDAYALPEYVWWKDLASRRLWNGRYGAGLYGYFNRLVVEASVLDSRSQQYASADLEQPINLSARGGNLTLELQVLRRVALFATASQRQWRHRATDLAGEAGEALLLQDRDETQGRAGLRFRFGERLSLGVGIERLDIAFERDERDRSTTSNAPSVELRAEGPRWWSVLSASAPVLEPRTGSLLARHEGKLGHAQLGWRLRRGLEWRLYGARQLAFSYSADSLFSESERWGVAIQRQLGWRSSGAVFWESGRGRYFHYDDRIVRSEDLQAYGLALSFQLGEKFMFATQASRTRYHAGAAGERVITRVQTTF
ncbi:MAG: hypothetical protein V1750_03910, partial [Acidobacteriota bacterium]